MKWTVVGGLHPVGIDVLDVQCQALQVLIARGGADHGLEFAGFSRKRTIDRVKRQRLRRNLE